MATPQGEGPSDVVLKLAFQYLAWERREIYQCHKGGPLRNAVYLVCKRWTRLLADDEVARPLCDDQLRQYADIVRRRTENGSTSTRTRGEEGDEWFSAAHQILATQMEKQSVTGHSFRDIFVLSEKMGSLLKDHHYYGPDVRNICFPTSDNRTLRDACKEDYRWIVRPTIERLRSLFGEPYTPESQEVADMKSRLLRHARTASVLGREELSLTSKKELATSLGRLLVASTNTFDENLFSSESVIAATTGQIIGGINSLMESPEESEEEPSALFKKRRLSIIGLNWPISPVDSLCSRIRKLWPNENDIDSDVKEEERRKVWEGMIKIWWSGLGKPLRKLLVAVRGKLAERFSDVVPLPEGLKEGELPFEAIKLIVELDYHTVRKEIPNLIWKGLDPSLVDSIFLNYVRKSQEFCEKIRQEYHSVYDASSSPSHNAKILLDIFLAVRPRDPCDQIVEGQAMTREYCSNFIERMEGVMDSWNELVGRVRRDDLTLWDPRTITELKTFEQMWGHSYSCSNKNNGPVHPTREFDTNWMVRRFLYQTIASNEHVASYHCLRKEAEALLRDKSTQPSTEACESDPQIQKVVEKFRSFGAYFHTREHAMLALLPLLPHLSKMDSKKLVYAMFIQRNQRVGDTCPRGFSKSNFDVLYAGSLPCPKNNESDTQSLLEWARSHKIGGYSQSDVLWRLLGLPLPGNIISAMSSFLLENLYNQSLNDVNETTVENALGVLPFMARFCYENPNSAQIVWSCLGEAIENAVSVTEELGVEEVSQKHRETFATVVKYLIYTCVNTRAASTIPALRRLYDKAEPFLQFGLITLGALIERIHDAPRVFVDTRCYHGLYYEDQL